MDQNQTSFDQTPFALTFEQIKAQADANMKADKGQAVPVQSQTQVSEQTQSQTPVQDQAAPTAGGTTFLDMVAKAEHDLAKEAKAKEQEQTQPQEPAQEQAQPQAPTQESAQEPAGNITFDNLYAQASGATQETTFETLFAQAKDAEKSNSSVQAVEASAPAASGVPSFDDLIKQAKNETEAPAETGISFENIMNPVQEEPVQEEPVQEEPVQEAPVQEAPVQEAPVQEAPAQEEPVQEEPVQEAPAQEAPAQEEPVQKEPVQEEPVQEAPAQEAPAQEAPAQEAPAQEAPAQEESKAKKTGGRRGKKKAGAEEEEKSEPLPDITNDYKVDVLGEGKTEKTSAPVKTEGQTLSMEGLFTPEEIEAFRADIRTFVRKEFKHAMVGVVKELLAEFNE